MITHKTKFVSLDSCNNYDDYVTLAYIGATSWPAREKIKEELLQKIVHKVIQNKPLRLVTTEEIMANCKQYCKGTKFLVHDKPWVLFGELIKKYNETSKLYLSTNHYRLEGSIIPISVECSPGCIIGGESLSMDFHKKLIKRPQIGNIIIGKNCFIGPNAMIDRGTLDDTIIGDNCMIAGGAKISHNCIIEDNCVVQGNSVIAGQVKMKERAFVGAGCYIHRGVTLGQSCVVAGGSVVIHDVKANDIVAGNPAKSNLTKVGNNS